LGENVCAAQLYESGGIIHSIRGSINGKVMNRVIHTNPLFISNMHFSSLLKRRANDEQIVYAAFDNFRKMKSFFIPLYFVVFVGRHVMTLEYSL